MHSAFTQELGHLPLLPSRSLAMTSMSALRGNFEEEDQESSRVDGKAGKGRFD